MMRHRLKLVALALVVLAALAALGYFVSAPRTLRVAVGPIGSPDTRVIVAFQQALKRERAPIRLKLVLTDGPRESVAAFRARKADLAVMLSDAPLPDSAATVAVLRRDAAYFVTRPCAGIDRIGDLACRTIGIIKDRPSYTYALERILQHYGLQTDQVTVLAEPQQELLQAAREGQVDALFVVAPVSEKAGRMAWQAFPRNEDSDPGFLPVGAAEAIAAQDPLLETVDMARGLLGADPTVPAETTTTLATAHRLVAFRSLDEEVVSELTRQLAVLRLAIAAEAPIANEIELPSTEDRAAKLPIHPGTIAYAEGETKTFFERYGDWFYLGVMGLSLAGSVVAAFWSQFTSGRPPVNVKRDLTDIVGLIEAVKQAADPAELNALAERSEVVRAELVTAMLANEPDADQIATIRFLLDEFEGALGRRHAALAAARLAAGA